MSTIIWLLAVASGIFFSYQAFRREEFRKSQLVLWSALGIFGGLVLLWLIGCAAKAGKTDPFLFAFHTAFGTAVIGLSWGLFWGMYLSEKIFQRINDLFWGNSGVTVVKTYDQAVGFEINGKFANAIEAYQDYAQDDPRDYIIQERIARCHVLLNRPGESIRFLQKAIELLNSPDTKMKHNQKREEMARLLFLQRIIRRKFHLPPDKLLEEALRRDFSNTRFCGQSDYLLETYLEIWSDCRS